MTNNSKETERAELHKTIWRIANDLRGSVDGWDFKSYVLGMLFYRFISENLTGYINEQERRAGNAEFDYTTLSDKDAEFGRAETVREKGFYINLNAEEARAFIDNAFRDGAIPTAGTAITKILPPVSRFSKDNGHGRKKQTVLDKLAAFFERYFGLVS